MTGILKGRPPDITWSLTAATLVWISSALLPAFAASPERDATPNLEPPSQVWQTIFARPDFSLEGAIPSPPDNPLTPAKVTLGRALFSDPRLSGEKDRACSSCHIPARNFTDGLERACARDGSNLPRNTPSVLNLAWATSLFWDGRSPSLEAQARVPIEHPRELAGDLATAARRLNAAPTMKAKFAAAFPDLGGATPTAILQALASYERSLVSPPTRFDRWIAGENGAITRREYRGFRLFVGRAGCLACHGGWRLTDDRLHDIGLKLSGDLGRGSLPQTSTNQTLTKVPAFKTPSLRGVSKTAPYMHDGSKPTLADVLRHYATGIEDRSSLAIQLRHRRKLSVEEREDLLAFLLTL